MNTAGRIVVGVDGFESSAAALRWAIHQAKLTGAVVEAVTAWHIPPSSGLVAATDMPDYQDDARMIYGSTRGCRMMAGTLVQGEAAL
jgi:nucleotide-binding universal stress UspA family protein